jgi:putative alpha-1,2-mannosidase
MFLGWSGVSGAGSGTVFELSNGHRAEQRSGKLVALQTSQLLAGATEGDGDTLTITAIDNSPGAFGANSPLHGKATLNPNGTITYTPAPNFHGTATLHYTVSDGQGGTVAASTTAVAGKDSRERQQPIRQEQEEQRPAYMFSTYLIANNNTGRSQLLI